MRNWLQTLLWHPSNKGELFVTLEVNPLHVYDCIDAMDMSLNVSGVENCSYYQMYNASDNPLVGNATSLTAYKPWKSLLHCIHTVSINVNRPYILCLDGAVLLGFRTGWRFAIWDGTMSHVKNKLVLSNTLFPKWSLAIFSPDNKSFLHFWGSCSTHPYSFYTPWYLSLYVLWFMILVETFFLSANFKTLSYPLLIFGYTFW